MRRLKHVGPALIAGATAMLAAATAGCDSGDDLPRQAISGKVTLDNEPVTNAWISFRPINNNGVTTASAQVMDGTYSISRSDGLVPDNYRVTISKPEASPDAKPSPPKAAGKAAKSKVVMSPLRVPIEMIPLKYNRESKLSAEIKEGQASTFDFPLTSK